MILRGGSRNIPQCCTLSSSILLPFLHGWNNCISVDVEKENKRENNFSRMPSFSLFCTICVQTTIQFFMIPHGAHNWCVVYKILINLQYKYCKRFRNGVMVTNIVMLAYVSLYNFIFHIIYQQYSLLVSQSCSPCYLFI